ncbi:hypothetical protein HanIR_Chr10g0456141 [Helianthus annuus]|nr:hypothetical protein HanIR_Chr10g0456141 [Helianthus annuus]
MQKQRISVLEVATILISLVVILLPMVEPCSTSHGTLINMNLPSLKLMLLPSLGHDPSPTPGSSCGQTANSATPCKLLVNEKAFANRYRPMTTSSSPSPPSFIVSVETATNRKLMMGSHRV